LFVDRKIPPPYVPTKREVPVIARHSTSVFVIPEFTVVQLVPLSVERKTPFPHVPAKRFVPLVTMDSTAGFATPISTGVQVIP
jgi:hypothetical protein